MKQWPDSPAGARDARKAADAHERENTGERVEFGRERRACGETVIVGLVRSPRGKFLRYL